MPLCLVLIKNQYFLGSEADIEQVILNQINEENYLQSRVKTPVSSLNINRYRTNILN